MKNKKTCKLLLILLLSPLVHTGIMLRHNWSNDAIKSIKHNLSIDDNLVYFDISSYNIAKLRLLVLQQYNKEHFFFNMKALCGETANNIIERPRIINDLAILSHYFADQKTMLIVYPTHIELYNSGNKSMLKKIYFGENNEIRATCAYLHQGKHETIIIVGLDNGYIQIEKILPITNQYN